MEFYDQIPHRALVAVRITTLGLENLSNKLFLNRWNADLIDKAEEKVSIFELGGFQLLDLIIKELKIHMNC